MPWDFSLCDREFLEVGEGCERRDTTLFGIVLSRAANGTRMFRQGNDVHEDR